MTATQAGIVSTAIGIIYTLLVLVASAFLIRAYLRTRLSGLIWLLATLVAWPIVSRVLFILLPFLAQQRAENGIQLSLELTAFTSTIQGVLVVVTSIVLSQQLVSRFTAPAAYPLTGYASPETGYASAYPPPPATYPAVNTATASAQGTVPVYPPPSGNPHN